MARPSAQRALKAAGVLVAAVNARAKARGRSVIADLLVLGGVGVADHGIALISAPAAYVVGGLALVWFGLELARKPTTSRAQ